jgi:hypothetical protein
MYQMRMMRTTTKMMMIMTKMMMMTTKMKIKYSINDEKLFVLPLRLPHAFDQSKNILLLPLF